MGGGSGRDLTENWTVIGSDRKIGVVMGNNGEIGVGMGSNGKISVVMGK